MGKIRPPEPFLFEGGRRAVLLLHGFTGNSADVRQLGKYLNKQGYTCYGPHYSGHAVPPEELFRTTPDDWWRDVRHAFTFLQKSGYAEIAVCGLSLGGVFSLKCGYTFPVKGIIPMCAPVRSGTQETIRSGVIRYSRNYKKYEGESQQEIDSEMPALEVKIPQMLKRLAALTDEVRHHLSLIRVPAFVVQAGLDEMIDRTSADTIYQEIQSKIKQIKWYNQSTHVITLGTEKAQLHQDINAFLESLDWSVS